MTINILHTIETVPEAIDLLVSSLDDFNEIDPEMSVFRDTCLPRGYGLATDGEFFVLVNSEGYNYPRYRGPKIRMALLEKITPRMAESICVRKNVWKPDFTIETEADLKAVSASPYSYVDHSF